MGDQKDWQGADAGDFEQRKGDWAEKLVESPSDARDKNLDPLDLGYNASLIEDETLDSMEYITFDDLENFKLPSDVGLFIWKEILPLEILEQDEELLSKGIRLPEHWYNDLEYAALVQNAYYLGTILPEIARIKSDFSEGLISKEVVSSLIRDINARINARVLIGLNNSDQRLTLIEYREGVENPDILGVSKPRMMEVRDLVFGRFIKED